MVKAGVPLTAVTVAVVDDVWGVVGRSRDSCAAMHKPPMITGMGGGET